jgi:hypothetical protein
VIDQPPSAPVLALLAERQLLTGVILHADGDLDAARAAFRAAQVLDPSRGALDPAIYPPAVVAAFGQAISTPRGRGELVAEGALPPEASVFVDGLLAPRALQAGEGVHWIVAIAPGHRPKGAFARIRAGERTVVRLDLAPASAVSRIEALRADLGDGSGDPVAQRAALGEVAAAADVALLVVVRRPGPRAEAALYDAARAALGPYGPVDATRLAPPPDVGVVGDEPPPPEDPSWYQRWWGKGLLVVVGAAIVGTVVLVVTRDEASGTTIGDYCFAEDCP